MISDAMLALVKMTLASGIAILIVAVARKPLRHMSGARSAYWLWLALPACAFAALAPAPINTANAGLGMLPDLAAHPIADMLWRTPPSANHLGLSGNGLIAGLAVWLSGALLMFVATLWRQRSFVNSLGPLAIQADGTYRSVRALEPMLVGAWRPRIVLPMDFEARYPRQERDLVIGHERAHLRRHDPIVNAAAAVWLCLAWFNPLMYWAIARFRFDQELACDALVLGSLHTGRRHYANALLKTQLTADFGTKAQFTCRWHSDHPLKERINMLKHASPSLRRRLFGASMILGLLLTGSYAAWSSQPREIRSSIDITTTDSVVRIYADRATRLVDGKVRYSGNVLLTQEKLRHAKALAISFKSDRAHAAPDQRTVLDGNVRLEFGDYVLTTDRATIANNGVIKMSVADGFKVN